MFAAEEMTPLSSGTTGQQVAVSGTQYPSAVMHWIGLTTPTGQAVSPVLVLNLTVGNEKSVPATVEATLKIRCTSGSRLSVLRLNETTFAWDTMKNPTYDPSEKNVSVRIQQGGTYVAYSVPKDEPKDSGSSGGKVVAIVIAVLAAIAVVAAIALFLVCKRRKRRQTDIMQEPLRRPSANDRSPNHHLATGYQ